MWAIRFKPAPFAARACSAGWRVGAATSEKLVLTKRKTTCHRDRNNETTRQGPLSLLSFSAIRLAR